MPMAMVMGSSSSAAEQRVGHAQESEVARPIARSSPAVAGSSDLET